jgi:cell division septal protein FtsQ
VLAFAAAVAGLVTLVHGPWLRVTSVVHAGERYASSELLDAILEGYRGVPLLTIDSHALGERLNELAAVADADVQLGLPGALRVEIIEKAPAFVWRTGAVQLVGAADGSVMAELPLDASLADLERLPIVDDARAASRSLTVGDRLPAAEVRVALRLIGLDPELLGSRARRLSVTMDDEYGFLLASQRPAWRAAMGFYELDPREDQAAAEERLEQQLVAIRTLFTTRRELAVSWLDARNPGKVYWTP